MRKARMHWFWRAMIGLAAGLTLAVLIGYRLIPGFEWVGELLSPGVAWLADRMHIDGLVLIIIVIGVTPCLVVSLVTYGILTRWLTAGRADGELHCRRCDHILRGLSEPRCPECGERI